MSRPFKVGGFEKNRYEDGYRVYDSRKGFYDGKVADFDGQCEATKREAQALADRLNHE